ncbi:helix-turn-helix domain-containing protein [Bosea sp. NPDC003192]|uniref:helix-turn-helix domain-containing protein n=1 Tax=Bosea sp. NPDC003192 TaxID=3390551 RepID=UPI003CFC47A1
MDTDSRPAAFTVKGLQTYLSLSRTTIYRMIKSNEITPVRVGGRVLFRRADADALLGLKPATQSSARSVFD